MDELIKAAETALRDILVDPEASDSSIVTAAKAVLAREEGKVTVDNNERTEYEDMELIERVCPETGDVIKVPALVNIPDKMLPLLRVLNEYKIILAEGGRGSAKTQTVARIILLLCELRRLRAICGRELETNLEESLYTEFKDLIRDYELDWKVMASKMIHRRTGSEILFMGMKEATGVNIKGLAGADIIWMDEAETATNGLLSVLLPTPRKKKVLFFFTLNRKHRDDAVVERFEHREDCWHVKINYVDNPFFPDSLRAEMEECKQRSPSEYKHVWLGEPMEEGSDHIFNYQALWDSVNREPKTHTGLGRQRVMAVDVAGGGGDACVALVLERVGTSEFTVMAVDKWFEKDTMSSLGRVIALIGQYKPDVTIVDADGMGYSFCDRLSEARVAHYRYNGGSTNGIDQLQYFNTRAQAYWTAAQWFESEWLCVPERFKAVLSQLERMRRKYRSDGRNQVLAKQELKKDMGGKSPDEADALVMAVWAAVKYLRMDSYAGTQYAGANAGIKLVDGSVRRQTWRQ
jgi:phage terminase large subunit